jgi:hypothetical protein
VIKEMDEQGNKIIKNVYGYQIDYDKNFSIKSKLFLDGNNLTFNNYNDDSSLNHLFKIDDKATSSLIKYLEDNKVTKNSPNHVILKFEKDSEKAKDITNSGDGENYEISFVIEEQQSAQEYKIFKFLTIFTVSFGLLIMLFIKRLKKLAHGAE